MIGLKQDRKPHHIASVPYTIVTCAKLTKCLSSPNPRCCVPPLQIQTHIGATAVLVSNLAMISSSPSVAPTLLEEEEEDEDEDGGRRN